MIKKAATMSKKYKQQSNLTRFSLDIIGVIFLIIIIFPFIWLLLTSMKVSNELMTWPPTFIPSELTFEHYKNIFLDSSMMNGFSNTVIISSVSTFLAVAIGSAAAYSLSRVKFSKLLRNTLLAWFLITRMYPAIATAVPYYLIMRDFGLLDTKLALIITYTGFNLPFVIWLMMGFFEGIPKDLDRAAIIDGCSLWQRFTKVILPLSKPGLIATIIFSFSLAWNEFLFAMILTSNTARTMPTVVAGFITDRGYEFGMMSSLGVLLVIPVILLAWITQKHLVSGLTMGAVKE